MAAVFVQPLARPVERVLFGQRLVAFAIDALLLGIVLSFVHGLLMSLLEPLAGGMSVASHSGMGSTSLQFSSWWRIMP